jgi:hypothetical protein
MTQASIRLRTSNSEEAKRKAKEIVKSIFSERNTKAKNVFLAKFANRFLRLQYKAFLARAKLGLDEWGEDWSPLKPKTIADKKRLKVEHPEWINVRTGKLLASFEPLTEIGGRLYLRKDMRVTVSGNTITFVCTIPYSDRVDAVRGLFALAERLIEIAAEQAAVDTVKEIFPTERL